MKTWTIAGALIVAGAMLTGPAVAQTTPSSSDPSKDKAKSSTGTESGAAKTDSMKSDTGMKSDAGAAKSGRSNGMAAGKREHVKAAQQALKDKGHDPGPVDGVMGPKTQAALKDFQSKEGLKASGQLDTETMAKLGVEAKAGASADTGTSSPSASPGASSGSSSPSASPGASGSTSAPGSTGAGSKSGSTGGAGASGSSSGAPASSGGSSTGSSGTK